MQVVDGPSFGKEVLESKIPVVVDFYADWCPPCKMYSPAFERVAGKFEGRVKFVKVNVDNALDVAKQYDVMSIPSTILFKDGKPAANIVGAFADADLENWIKEHI
ncbi:Thiol:disulfide interchange protein DsbD [uncultured archaeon]|nr:Thiol:disulfide interchange protein DsbD [uncultured archaeon]